MCDPLLLRFREANADYVERLLMARPYSPLLKTITVVAERPIRRGFKRDLADVELAVPAETLALLFERHHEVGAELSAEYAIHREVEAVMRIHGPEAHDSLLKESGADESAGIRTLFRAAHDGVWEAGEAWTPMVLDPVRAGFTQLVRDAQRYCAPLREVRIISARDYQLGDLGAQRVEILASPRALAIWNTPKPGQIPVESLAAGYLAELATAVLGKWDKDFIPF